jgi:hypothetical protein
MHSSSYEDWLTSVDALLARLEMEGRHSTCITMIDIDSEAIYEAQKWSQSMEEMIGSFLFLDFPRGGIRMLAPKKLLLTLSLQCFVHSLWLWRRWVPTFFKVMYFLSKLWESDSPKTIFRAHCIPALFLTLSTLPIAPAVRTTIYFTVFLDCRLNPAKMRTLRFLAHIVWCSSGDYHPGYNNSFSYSLYSVVRFQGARDSDTQEMEEIIKNWNL